MGYVGRRVAYTLFVLWAVATILFFMFRLMPGDPRAAFIDNTFTEEQQQLLLQQFGLDQPLHVQYWKFLVNLVQGDLGVSFIRKEPVLDMVLEVLPNSIVLTLTSLIVAYAFGIVAGAFIARMRGTWVEGIAIPAVLTTRAAPEFWLGMVFLAIFAFSLGWFPAGGAVSPGVTYDSFWEIFFSSDYWAHLALPVITLALYLQGLPLLLMRSNMLEVMEDEFVTMARMKGLSEWAIVMRHAARNALLPVATAFALGVGFSVGGNVVIETVFSWPGIGRMLVTAVSSSDYPLAQGAFLLITLVLVTANFIADLLYAVLDPRVTHGDVR
jgi:peptide/nickel transport system permease protein